MCTQPILIKNKKFQHISVDFQNKYIHVPCGVCDECLQSRASSLYVRARMEFDSCIKSGGCGFMCCLTYSNDLVPTLEIEGKIEFVFRKKDVIDFIKRLRTNLERKYQKYFHVSAPKFKYLITSEFGSDPKHTHRPHYHLLFFFHENVSFTIFRKSFVESTYNRRNYKVKRYFGFILQCDPLDPGRGGIKYSGKYILKDLMYEKQRIYINEQIKFQKDYVNSLFHIITNPSNLEEEFQNKCIRKSKDYIKAVETYVLPYRHMLQFYLCSNDLGISAIVQKYGLSLVSQPYINFEGFPYSLPKLVKDRIERDYGRKEAAKLSRKIFVNFVTKIFDFLVLHNNFDKTKALDLLDFAKTYIQPRYGTFYLVNPYGIDFDSFILSDEFNGLMPWDDIINDFQFFDDNDFFTMRYELLQALDLYNSSDNLKFRASLARQRKDDKQKRYELQKRNKYGI